ncbi:MAG: bifunctional pyr operon transcriptional regulator/uracil phosphoribosyltransferase PyrR [Xanthomonadales bacterium]|nr:bifunctional pyr operon transcriptional regulator/uracil phosphoribosyltransferase PyrR [Xanthomonadales bacterium]
MPANPTEQVYLPDMASLLETFVEQVENLLEGIEQPVIVGIHTGGLWLAQYLARKRGDGGSVGELDIGFHRDDFDARGLTKPIRPSRIDGTLEGQTVLLVDDVIHTGRTTRAAINSLYDFGRPGRILLAVLVDRSGRELPIQPDASAIDLELPEHCHIRLSGPDPLALRVTGGPNG